MVKKSSDLASTIANLAYTPTLLAYGWIIVHWPKSGICLYLIVLSVAYKSGAFHEFSRWPMVSKIALYSGAPFIVLGLYFSTKQTTYTMLIPLVVEVLLSIVAGLALRRPTIGHNFTKSRHTLYTYVGNDPLDKTDPSGTDGMFVYTPAEAQSLAITQQMNALGAQAATSHEVRQMELRITAGFLAVMGLLGKSPTATKLSIVAAAAALVDQKVTTGHVDSREVAVTVLGTVPGLKGITTAASGMKAVGEAAKLGQEFVHAGAAAAGAGLAVGEAMPEKVEGAGQRPVTPKSQPRVPGNQSPPPPPGPWASCARGIPSTC